MTTATIHPREHHQTYRNFPSAFTEPSRSHIPHSGTSTLSYPDYPPAESPEGDDPPSLDPPKNRLLHDDDRILPLPSPNMASRMEKRPDWNKFYENGIPKEVIVIDDSSPEAPEPAPRKVSGDYSKRISQHQDKKRRVESSKHDPVHHVKGAAHNPDDQSSSENTSQDDRTNSALYSTAPTSLTSTGSSTHAGAQQPVEQARAGQKRKRSVRKAPEDESPEPEPSTHTHNWSNYVPPSKPLIKAKDVYVTVVRDRTSSSSQKIDDDDGHYIVHPDAELTDRYQVVKLLGQGTFGKVVEAFDKKRKTKCAVKIIRAVPKYRDASRIELRVLSTLAQNDIKNRNRCIHLRDCFDFRNHICIVTDLLGKSVFDFLKENAFVPFPSTHIQSFARQLFTSVAFLHDLNLIHTDLKPENILLASNLYQTFTYNRAIPTSSKVNPRQAKYRKVLLNPEIRLIDFGSATFDDEYHSSVVSTRHYRAPEIILNLGWSYPCDIWSIGCILVEFFTGDALFQTHDNLEHLAMMEAVCKNKIEKEMIQQVRGGKGRTQNSAAAFFPPRAFRLDYPNSETPRASKKYVKGMKHLEETIPPNNRFNEQFLDLLRRIFVYDPKKRITAKQALAHPWFKETLQDDGTEALKIRLHKEAASAKAPNGHR